MSWPQATSIAQKMLMTGICYRRYEQTFKLCDNMCEAYVYNQLIYHPIQNHVIQNTCMLYVLLNLNPSNDKSGKTNNF